MASYREIEMWRWIDRHNKALKRAYGNYIRKLAEEVPFRPLAVPSWREWTSETFNTYYHRRKR